MFDQWKVPDSLASSLHVYMGWHLDSDTPVEVVIEKDDLPVFDSRTDSLKTSGVVMTPSSMGIVVDIPWHIGLLTSDVTHSPT
jgi:hypothetical protein